MMLNLTKNIKKNKLKVVSLPKGKIMPHAIELEELVLGAMLIDEKGVDDVMPVIKNSTVFYKEKHRHVFEAIVDLYNKSQPIDIITVSSKLKSFGKLDEVGGDFFLIGLTQKISSSAHSEYHARILLQMWMKREYIKTTAEAQAMCYDETIDVFDIENYIELKLDAIREATSAGSNQLTMQQATEDVVKRVEILSNMVSGEITGVPTGFEKLDVLTGGWQNNDLIIIAARPGMGKSAFCTATVLAAALNNIPVGIISLEMSTIQLVTRLMANNSNTVISKGFHLNQLFRHGFDKNKIEDYHPKLIKLKDNMKHLPVYFNDTPALDIRDVKTQARIWKRKHKIKLLVVDYLQLIKDATKNNREQEISSISGTLKAIAKELNIPVIALSQLSRKVEDRGGLKKPQLADLRESGAIENDADLIGFIWRPEYYGFDVPQELHDIGANTEFHLAKHRNGSLDRKGIWFDDNKTKFQDRNPDFKPLPY